jgi:hypothetical protein
MSSVPRGPALKVTGGAVCKGPVVGGVGSGCGSAGDCVEGSCAFIGIHAITAKPNKHLNGYLPIVPRIGVSTFRAVGFGKMVAQALACEPPIRRESERLERPPNLGCHTPEAHRLPGLVSSTASITSASKAWPSSANSSTLSESASAASGNP